MNKTYFNSRLSLSTYLFSMLIIINVAVSASTQHTRKQNLVTHKRSIGKKEKDKNDYFKNTIQYNCIYNGIPWYDNNRNTINAHGACLLQEKGKYYLFGEYKTDSINKFIGFSCYSSSDLVNWRFERLVLSPQNEGILGPNRIGERVKVMRCPSTGEYVMYMHCDDLKYNDPYIAYATSKTIAGEYQFQGPLMCNGIPIKKWDMGTFQDTNGKGYLLIHHGINYRLSNDYKFAEAIVADNIPGAGESPAMFKKNGIYYLLYSNLTSWERNDNFYYTAPSAEGPWTKQGLFCPEGSLTWNSQCTYVFPLIRGNDTIPMYMGDRWSFPRQASAATYVWLPMQTNGTKLSIPEYRESWDMLSEIITAKDKSAQYKKKSIKTLFRSNRKGEFYESAFSGSQIAVFGETTPHGGYARMTINNKQGVQVFNSLVDFYSKVPHDGLRFISPLLPKGKYKLKIEVTGDRGIWYKKDGTQFGSDDSQITINRLIVL